MVEEGDEADAAFVVKGGWGGEGIDKGGNGAVGHAEVVEAGGEDEFAVEAAKAGGLGVVEDELEVDNGGGGDGGFGGDELHDVGVVAFGGGFEGREVLVWGFVGGRRAFRSGEIWSLAGSVEFCGHETSDREELGFLVEVESLLTIEMDR